MALVLADSRRLTAAVIRSLLFPAHVFSPFSPLTRPNPTLTLRPIPKRPNRLAHPA